MNKMEKDYNDILNINFDRENEIPYTGADSLIALAGREAESLDGEWGFMPDVFRTFTRKKLASKAAVDEKGRPVPMDLDLDRLEKAPVPGCWNCVKERYWYYEGEAIYEKTFSYQAKAEGERLFLHIGAANYECRVWLNGELLARHRGGFTPFDVELTGKVKAENRLILTVNNRRETDQVPSITYDWMNYGGITRSVELYRLPKRFIKEFTAELVPDGTYRNIFLEMKLDAPEAGRECVFSIPELQIEETVVTDGEGRAQVTVEAAPELWSCEDPRLYRVICRCMDDQIEDFVGFREIRARGKEVLLNGAPVYLKGVCCHEESKNGGRITTDEERLEILHTAKEMGCNILRLTHYPHSERMAKLADREGVMLWEEIPVYWALEFSNPDTYANAENQLRELIRRDRNRASVVIWSVGNENPDTQERLDFMRRLAEVCREMDRTRLVSAACLVDVAVMQVKDRLAQYIDLVSFNEYYGWYYRDYEGLKEILDNTELDKPMAITETGAGAKAGLLGGDEELFTEEHQEKVYQKQIQYTDGRIQGLFPWVLYDFISPIRMHPLQEGKNSKGLVAMDKTYRKKAFYVMQEYYRNKK